MCRPATTCALLFAGLLLPLQLFGQQRPAQSRPDWRRIGPRTLDLGLASPASGPVERVWYSADGNRLFARTPAGKTYVTSDFESWRPSDAIEPARGRVSAPRLPEPDARVASAQVGRTRLYAAGVYAYRSDDGGASWTNLTSYRTDSILGDRLYDVAVSPLNADELTVAGATGLWRSLDGGDSWAGLNDKLPNLPVKRLYPPAPNVPIAFESTTGSTFTWQSGQKGGWRLADSGAGSREKDLLSRLTSSLQVEITAVAVSGETVYAGSSDGRLHVSQNGGAAWRPAESAIGGRIERIISDPAYPPFALAITSSSQRGRVLRTVNGGLFWEDISANLPAGAVRGIAADRVTGAVYAASENGVFVTYTDTVALGPATPWLQIRSGSAADVALDVAGNQIFAAMEGDGVVTAIAPHRMRNPSVVSAADRTPRAAAPGALISVLGAKVQSARAGDRAAAVLSSEEAASDVQLPYELPSGGVVLSIDSAVGRVQVGLPVVPAAPGIFVDRDGNPMILDATTGLVLDAATPARSGARLQVFATGLGQVTPVWPLGLPAPLEDAPRVVLPVQVLMNGEALEVTKATLAPGYVGLYLIEIQLPPLVDRGTAFLTIQAGNVHSNYVRLLLEP